MGPFEDADWMPRGDWQGYEAYVGGWLSARFPGVRLEADVRLLGRKSGTARQIDILARGKKTVAIECKYVGRKIDAKCVEAFIGMLDDIGIEDGIIITAVGFSKAAQQRAINDRRGVHLEIVIPERLSDYQHRQTPLNCHATAKVQRLIMRDCLAGTNGREKREGWVPCWMSFPPSTYADRGGVGSAKRWATIAPLCAQEIEPSQGEDAATAPPVDADREQAA